MSEAKLCGQDWRAHLLHQYERAYRLGIPTVTTTPLDVSIELNQTCNLRCPMCARVHSSSDHAAPSIYRGMDPQAQMDPAVLNAVTPWIGNALAVHAYGFGEPLLSPLLDPLVRRAKKTGAYVDFFTNGHLISEEKASFFVEWKVDRVVLSASGATEKVYEQIHKADLSRLQEGAENLRVAKQGKDAKPRVDLNVILQRGNVDQLETFLSLGENLGVTHISFKPLMVYDEKMEADRVDLGELSILERLRKLRENAKLKRITVDWNEASSEAGTEGPTCFMPWRSVFVQWDGTVRADCFGGPVLGNLLRQKPREIWEGDSARRFRESVANGQYPDSCSFCLNQGIRPLRDDLRDLFALAGGVPPEPVGTEESNWGKPGPLRIRLADAPCWSTWARPTTYRLTINNLSGSKQFHLVVSLYPKKSPSFPARHHGYWTVWNVPLQHKQTKLELELTSSSCECRVGSEVLTGEYTSGKYHEAGEYVLDFSLRSVDTEQRVELKSRQVFIDSDGKIGPSLDQHWPDRRRRHPNWMEPDRATLQSLSDKIRTFASSYASPGKRVVDLGCGDKPYYPFFSEGEMEYVGIDLYPGPYVDLVETEPPFSLPTESFDLCLLTQVMEHLQRPTEWVSEAFRLLKPGGRLFLSAPLLWEVHYVPRDYYRFTEEALRDALEGFLVEKCAPCGGPTATLLQCRNLLSQRKSGQSSLSRWSTFLRNLYLTIFNEDEDPTFTPNFVIVAQKPELLTPLQEPT